MRFLNFFKILFIICFVFSSLSFAASENEGKTGMAFLKVGVGARSAGMGEAYTAVASDASAAYWNPAGLVSASGSNVALVHNRWLLDVGSEFGALQIKKHLAFHVYNYHIGDIPVRTIPSEQPLEKTSAQYLSIGGSYARSINQKLDAGFTVKYLFEKIFVHSASGFAFDFGLRYKMIKQNLCLAAVVQNLGKMNELENEATRLPVISRFGAMYLYPQNIGPMNLMFAFDIVKPLEENLRMHIGGEAVFWNQIALRAGLMNGYENRNISFGVGIHKSAFQFDYSMTPLQEDFDTGHRFALRISL